MTGSRLLQFSDSRRCDFFAGDQPTLATRQVEKRRVRSAHSDDEGLSREIAADGFRKWHPDSALASLNSPIIKRKHNQADHDPKGQECPYQLSACLLLPGDPAESNQR